MLKIDPTGVLGEAEIDSLDRDGYVVLEGVLTDAECELVADELDRAWYEHRLDLTADSERGVRFVGNALAFSPAFESMLLDPRVLEAAARVVGERLVLNLINGRSPAPGAEGQPLHVLDRRRGKPFDKCNAIWCLDEFTVLNGATRVLPGSHLDDREALRRMRDPMASHPDEVVVEAPKGSVVFHNSHLIHSGRPNASDGDRRSVHAAYTHPAVPTHYDWSELPESIVHRRSPRMLALLDLLD